MKYYIKIIGLAYLMQICTMHSISVDGRALIKEFAIGAGAYVTYYAAHTLGHIAPIYLLLKLGYPTNAGTKNPDIQFSFKINPIQVTPHFTNPYLNAVDNIGGMLFSAITIYGLYKLNAYYKKSNENKDGQKHQSIGINTATMAHTIDNIVCTYKDMMHLKQIYPR